MQYFDNEYKYISTNQAQNIATSAFIANKVYINQKQAIKRKKPKNGIINIAQFRPEDSSFLTEELLNSFRFKDLNFIKSHDILEEINNQNSIGLYIDKNDINLSEANINFIKNATKRLNKYLKNPKLYIFTQKRIEIDTCIENENLILSDWKEEFYFLISCKHKIILNTKHSYSNGLWATLLNQKDYYYAVFDKNRLNKKHKINWIGLN